MAYLSIADFRFGMDRRRPQYVGVPGTFYTLKNALISRGGDVVRAKKFVSTYTLPANTFDLYSLRGQLIVFGSQEPPTMPVGVRYVRALPPNGADMTRVLDVRAFDNQLYIIAEHADGNIRHYLVAPGGSEATHIRAWDDLAAENSDWFEVANYLAERIDDDPDVSALPQLDAVLITARVPGTPFTVSASATDNLSLEHVAQSLANAINGSATVSATAESNVITVTARVPGTAFTIEATPTDGGGILSDPAMAIEATTENADLIDGTNAQGSVKVTAGTASPGVNKITSVKVAGTELLVNSVDWNTSHSQTMIDLIDEINANTAEHLYTASLHASGSLCVISAPVDSGTEHNGEIVVSITAGDVITVDTNMHGAVDDVDAVAQVATLTLTSGFPDVADTWAVTIDGATIYTRTGAEALASDPSSPTASQTTLQANVAQVAETRATGTVTVTGGTSSPGVNKVSQITVNGVDLLAVPVDWRSSNSATANALVVEITNNASTSTITASAVGAVVTIFAAVGTGTKLNGDAVVATVAGDVTASTTNMAGGVAAVDPVAQVVSVQVASGEPFDAEDAWTIVVNGRTYRATGRAAGSGTSAFVQKQRIWDTANTLLRYCALSDAATWSEDGPDEDTDDDPAETSAGFINISQQTEGSQRLTAVGNYNGKAAIFSPDSVVIYMLDTDATLIAYDQTLDNTGTFAPRSVVSQGNVDLFYLDQTGVRTIRSRDGYNAAYVADVGSAIDPFAQELIDEAGARAAMAQAIIDPLDGRYMLAIGQKILCLSYFPDAKITAWSYLDMGFDIDNLVRANRDIYLRSGNTIYRYGGVDRTTYPDADESVIVAETPFMDAKDPAALKLLEGFDVALTGTWLVDVLVDPNDTTVSVRAGYIDLFTYHLRDIKLPGETSHVAFRFTCASAGNASLSSLAIHFDKEQTG